MLIKIESGQALAGYASFNRRHTAIQVTKKKVLVATKMKIRA